MRNPSVPAIALATGLLLAPLTAQTSRNATVVGRFNNYSAVGYNDIWAFVSPANGKEYCLLCARSGISVLDCSNPANPVERGFIAGGGNSTWRDVKTFGNYAYGVTERSGEGMLVIDLTNPDSPSLVQKWESGFSGFRNAHNIAMDFGRGIAYLCGSRTAGTLFVDVKTNPRAPSRIGNLSSPYMHDLAIQNDWAYMNEQNNNSLRIYDITGLPALSLLSNTRLQGTRISHNVWPSWDDMVCLATNEDANGPITFLDISNKRSPQLLGVYRTGGSQAIPHNAYITDYVGYASYYTEGMRAMDISGRGNPVEVGFVDTYSGPSQGYNGVWGCTPALPSGHVYISDQRTGLYIIKPKASAVYYGKGTTGTGGKLPRIWKKGAAYLGNTSYELNVRDAKATSAAILLLGAGRTDVTVSGLNLLIDLTLPIVVATNATSASGQASQPFPIPNISSLNGLVLYAQYYVTDGGSASSFGLSATQGMCFELFAR